MLSKESIIRRLAIAKYLYKLGLSQSQLPESIAFSSLLSFHDAVEIFLKLAAEKENIKSDNFRFLEYWDKILALTLKESMRHLNERRVNLKHKGILPAKQDLEITRVNVTDFFEQNTKQVFGIEFADISMINLISFPAARNFLEKAQKAVDNNQLANSIENSAFAFYELLECYEKNKNGIYHKSPFFFGEKMRFWASSDFKLREFDSDLAENIGKMKSSIEALQESMKVMCLGIDYRKFSMFKLLTPIVTKTYDNKYRAEIWDDKIWNRVNCQFCIDFVIESALKLQEFDYDINQLIDNDPPTLEYVSGDFKTGVVFREIPKKQE